MEQPSIELTSIPFNRTISDSDTVTQHATDYLFRLTMLRYIQSPLIMMEIH